MFSWGKSGEGQLGLGDVEQEVVTPREVSFFTLKALQVRDISCGWYHSAFITEDGLLYTCGNNDNGQICREGPTEKPDLVKTLETVKLKNVSCGENYTVVVSTGGHVYSCGDSKFGRLGRESESGSIYCPRLIRNLHGHVVLQVSCGASHAIAVTEVSRLFSWGGNEYGQLGVGSTEKFITTPQQISSLFGLCIAQVSAGGYHSFALTTSGALFTWGRNRYGQLGLGDSEDRNMPVFLRLLKSHCVRHICCGEEHTVALTKSGGVFTFGFGKYGQLGHNSVNNECNPRKVFELMGSEVVQVACGRRHTLAYVPSAGRLYAFGQGGWGQLGVRGTRNLLTPAKVAADWLGQPVGLKRQIKLLRCGGNHSFVTTGKPGEVVNCDMRNLESRELPLVLSESSVLSWVRDASAVEQPVEVFRKLFKVFSSQGCLNGSFLHMETFEETSSKVHGIDLASARKSFHLLSTIPHTKCKFQIFSALEKHLIPSLSSSPPNVEALRLYILLPELKILDDPEGYTKILIGFGDAILHLVPFAQNVLGKWWSSLPPAYLSQVILIFKNCIQYHLQLPSPLVDLADLVEMKRFQKAIATSLMVLDKLNHVNSQNGNIVPFTHFYIPDIPKYVDIKADFEHWIKHGASMFSFCNFPFVFDAETKSTLLQLDALLHMQAAVDEVHQRNIASIIFHLPIDPTAPFLILVVPREDIVRHTLRQVMRLDPLDLKKPLKVVFAGEEAVDAGGVRKEFFLLLVQELFDPTYGMFKYFEESGALWFNDQTFEEAPMFLLIGVLCGLAIYNSTIIDLKFPCALYKKLLGKEVILDDLRDVQPAVAKNLQNLLDYPDEDVEEVFSINFQIVKEKYGVLENIDLVPGGGDMPVTSENREEYVKVYLDYFFNKSVKQQFSAFFEGFHRVCRGRVLKFFQPSELMAMVIGSQDYEFHDLETVARYEGEYHRNHPVIKNFWDVLHEFPTELKRKFLEFLTGSDRVPLTGMKSMKIVVQPVSGGSTVDYLPVAHTCFNLLDLPKYPNKEVMRTKLTQAVQYSKGFGLA